MPVDTEDTATEGESQLPELVQPDAPDALVNRIERLEIMVTQIHNAVGRVEAFACKLETALDNLAHHPLVGKFMGGNGEGGQ